MKIIIANSNPVYRELEQWAIHYHQAHLITQKSELTEEILADFQPDFIFFPHWSHIIPPMIYESYACVVFHMTDLPYGRGGSPLQNLIVRGHQETMISALQVEKGLDTGAIYLKRPLSLQGTATEIFLRAGMVMKDMIQFIIDNRPTPIPQSGVPTTFHRRKPADGNIASLEELSEIFDYIRMLDAEGYPSAFIETEHFKFYFSRASLKKDHIIADVRIIPK